MRWRYGLLIPAVVGVLSTWAAGHARQGDNPQEARRFVLTDREAFWLADAELVVGPRVSDIEVSFDGRYLLAQRERLALSPATGRAAVGENSLVLWDSRSRRSTTVWRQPANNGAVQQVDWIPGTDLALVQTVIPGAEEDAPGRHALHLVDASRAASRPLRALGPGEGVLVSPAEPLALLWGEGAFRLIRTNGTIGEAMPLPRNAAPYGSEEAWSEDGRHLYLMSFSRSPGAAGERPVLSRSWHVLDPRTGRVTALPARPKPSTARKDPRDEKVAALPVRLKPSTGTVKEEDTVQTLRPVWLVSASPGEHSRALLAPDAQEEAMLPNGAAALYRSGGSLYAVPFVRIEKAAFLEARREAMQAVTLSNAKQIGIALMMYAQDYDETFPPASDAVNDVILPYVKSSAIFNSPHTGAPGFVYSQNGGTLGAIAKPAETVIGYLPGPGGRAVIHADGHVTWQPD